MNFPLFDNMLQKETSSAPELHDLNTKIVITKINANNLAGKGISTKLYLCKLFKHKKEVSIVAESTVMARPA